MTTERLSMLPSQAACPDDGVWRAWLDGQAGAESEALARHAATCAGCRAVANDLRANATFAASLFDTLAEPTTADLAAAGQRHAPILKETSLMHAAPLSFFTARLPHWRLAASAAAAALALTFLVGTPRGQAMAAQFLAQFRSERLAVVTVDPRNAGNLEALNHLGTVTGGVGQARQPQTVSTVAEASQRVGFQVRQPDPKTLPTGLNPTPTIRVTTATQLRFTFDRAKALAYFQSIGRSDVSVPAKFDQATLVVSIPAAALLQYQSQTPARTVPAPAATAEASRGRQPSADQVNAANTSLLIGESGDLVVGTEGGVSLDEFRELLLGLPGLPRETVDQLRAIQDWRTTLPIPVPVDQVSWKATTVNGAQGIALTGNSGLGSGVIWQQDGHIYGVAGFATDAEVQGVANALAR